MFGNNPDYRQQKYQQREVVNNLPGAKEVQKQQKAQEKDFYLNQFREAEDYEERRKYEEAEKKAKLRQELVESHQRQLREKQEKAEREKEQDARFTKSIVEESTFANQDKQRDQFFQRLKTNAPSQNQYSQNQSVRGSNKSTDIFNNEIVERVNIKPEAAFDEKAEKRRKEREIFEENQRVANQKKFETTQQKSDQKLIEYYKSRNDQEDYEREQAQNNYKKNVQKDETRRTLGQQVNDKMSIEQYGDEYDYQQREEPVYRQQAPLQENAYYKNKQRGTGAGYNILTGN